MLSAYMEDVLVNLIPTRSNLQWTFRLHRFPREKCQEVWT